MLSVAAMRLAAVEALCPTGSLISGTGFPTLAGARVFDSRTVALDDLAEDSPWTPSLSIYSEGVNAEPYGDIAPSTHGRVMADLVIVAELSVRESSDGEDGDYAEAAASDPEARILLDALCAQVRKRLVYDPEGFDFRSGLVASVDQLRIEPFSIPQFGIRLCRMTMTFRCQIADDQFTDAGGLAGPVARLKAKLPPQSHALATLNRLEAALTATARDPLETIGLNIPPLSAEVLPTATSQTLEIDL